MKAGLTVENDLDAGPFAGIGCSRPAPLAIARGYDHREELSIPPANRLWQCPGKYLPFSQSSDTAGTQGGRP